MRLRDSEGVGIIELSAQWSDGGHVVALMEAEMSFLAKLIVQKEQSFCSERPPAPPPARSNAHCADGVEKHAHTHTPSWIPHCML